MIEEAYARLMVQKETPENAKGKAISTIMDYKMLISYVLRWCGMVSAGTTRGRN
jgi:hypothetical protein